jgi:integrase
MTNISTKNEYHLLLLFERFIADSKSGKRLQANGKKLTNGSIVNYECMYKLLVKYSTTKKVVLRIKTINKLTQRQLAVEKNYWLKFYKNFTQFLYVDCKHFDNYVGSVMKVIRAFFGYLEKSLLLQVGVFYKQFYVRKEEIPIITLLPEQLNYLIYDTAFEATLTKRMLEVKDVFVFGCTVALRFSDLMALKQTNLRKNNDAHYLITRSIKTGTESQIQLPDYSIAILQKYKKLKSNFLLPRFNNVNLNKFVKRLTEMAGFTQQLTKKREKRGVLKDITPANMAKVSTKNLDQKKQPIRFCDLVTTHTMRRTAITTMLCLGMPEHLVRKISGHSPMSKEFYRYVALAQTYQDKETTSMFDKLKNKVMVA